MLKKYFIVFLMIIFIAMSACATISPVNSTNLVTESSEVDEESNPGRTMTAEEIKTGAWWVVEAASFVGLAILGHGLFWH